MTSSDLKNKQFQSLLRKRTSSSYGRTPVDNLYKKKEKLPNTVETRNFDPNIGSDTPKPHAKPRQTSLSNLLHDTSGGKAAHVHGEPTRRRLEGLHSRTVEVVDLDKAENDNGSRHKINGVSNRLLKDNELKHLGGRLRSDHRSYGPNSSPKGAIDDAHYISSDDDSSHSHHNHKSNASENNYLEKIELSSRIRERLDNLTSRTNRLLDLKSSYTPHKRDTKRTLISSETKSSDASPAHSHHSPSPMEKQPYSKARASSKPITDVSPSASPSPAPSVSQIPEFTKVQDCDGNQLDVKNCGLNLLPQVRHVLKSFQYHGQKLKRRSQRTYEIAVSLNGKYIYIGWRHPSLDLIPIDKFVVKIDSQLKNFSFANESFIIQLTRDQGLIIASHYGHDDDIREYFTKHPNSKVKVDAILTEAAVQRLMEGVNVRSKHKTADPLANVAFQKPRRSSPRISKMVDEGIEYVGNVSSDDDEPYFFDHTDYHSFEPIPDFNPELRYKFHDGPEITVTERDFTTLQRNNWVNDVIIDFGLKYIVEDAIKKGLVAASEIHSFNSFFYTKLTSGQAGTHDYYTNIKRWLSKVDLMKLKYLIIPVNTGLHWFCCIIRNLPGLLELAQARKAAENEPIDIDESDLQPKTNQYAEIFALDSLGSKRNNVSVPLKSFIIGYCKEKFDVDINRDQIRFQTARIPRQNNSNDCGVHVLFNVRKWLSNISECEIFFKKHLYGQAKALFPAEERRNERKYWSKILLNLHRDQNPSQKDGHEPVEHSDDEGFEIVEGSEHEKHVHPSPLNQTSSGVDDRDHNSAKRKVLEKLNALGIEEVTNDEVTNDEQKIAKPVSEESEPKESAQIHEIDAGPHEEEEPYSLLKPPKESEVRVKQTDAQEGSSADVEAQVKPSESLNQSSADKDSIIDTPHQTELKNLALRKEYKDVQLTPGLCQLLNKYYPDKDTHIKGVRLIVIKKHIAKALNDPASVDELENLLQVYSENSHRSNGSGNSDVSLPSKHVLSNTNGDVTKRIEELKLANGHSDEEENSNRTPFISLHEFNGQQRNDRQKLHNTRRSSPVRGFSGSSFSSMSPSRGGFGSNGFRNNPTKSKFGFRASEGHEFHKKKKAARDIVEADGFDTAAHEDSDDSDVVLDYPPTPHKRRKLD